MCKALDVQHQKKIGENVIAGCGGVALVVAVGRLRQTAQGFKASLDHTVRCSFKRDEAKQRQEQQQLGR